MAKTKGPYDVFRKFTPEQLKVYSRLLQEAGCGIASEHLPEGIDWVEYHNARATPLLSVPLKAHIVSLFRTPKDKLPLLLVATPKQVPPGSSIAVESQEALKAAFSQKVAQLRLKNGG